jgi:DNA invertase Pin-like site-specific DNA recombinase
MRLAAYLRVSTETQTEGLGLDVQETAIREWAAEHGHTIAGTYTDAGISGSNGLDTRAALADALAALKTGEAEGLVIYRLDRLARDLILQEQLLADIRRGGWQAFSTSDAEAQYLTDDPADPSRKMIRQVLGAVAEYERAMIALRLRGGRQRKASNGGFAGGATPYGFRSADGELVADPGEQVTLARIREMRATNKSYEQIAQILNADRIKSRRGGAWHRAVIARIA